MMAAARGLVGELTRGLRPGCSESLVSLWKEVGAKGARKVVLEFRHGGNHGEFASRLMTGTGH